MATTDLEILLTAKDDASKVLKQTNTTLQSTTKEMDKAGKAATDAGKGFDKSAAAANVAKGAFAALGVSAAAIAGVLGVSLKAAIDEEQGMARLAQAVDQNGGSWAKLGDQIEGQISKWEKLTAFSDGEMRDSLATLTGITGDATEAMKRLPVAMDLARGAGIDLETASKMLGKITDENTGGLKKLGVALKDGATAADVLVAVQEKFGGQAAKFGETAAGKWQILTNQIDNLKEDIGAALLPAFEAFATGATTLIDNLRNGPLPGIIARVQELAGEVRDKLAPVWAVVSREAAKVPGVIAQVFGSIGEMFDVLSGNRKDAGGVLRSLVGGDQAEAIMGVLGRIREAFSAAFDLLKPIVQGVIDKVAELRSRFEELPPALQTFAAALVASEVTGFNDKVIDTGASLATMTTGIMSVSASIAAKGGLAVVLSGAATSLGGLAVAAAAPTIVLASLGLAVWAVVEVVKTAALIIENWDKVGLTGLGRTITATKNAVGDFFSSLGSYVEPFGRFLGLFVEDAPRAIGITLGLVVQLPNAIGGAFVELAKVADKLWTGLWSAIGSTLREALRQVIYNVASWADDLALIVSKVALGIVEAFVMLPYRLYDLAGEIIGGLAKGLLDNAPKAWKAITDIAGGVLGGFKEALGIHSPSEDFIWAGKQITEGLAVGIESTSDRPVNALAAVGRSLVVTFTKTVDQLMAQAAQSMNGTGAANNASRGLGGSAPATMYGTTALTNAATQAYFAGVPFYAEGTPYVPQDGLAYLHRGERVVPADQNGAGAIDYGRLAAALAAALRSSPLTVTVDSVHAALLRKLYANGTLALT